VAKVALAHTTLKEGEVYSWAVEYAKVEKYKCKSQQFASSLHVCANTEGMIRAVLNKNHFTVVLKNSLHFTHFPLYLC
jgi:hypothetical protein